MASIWSELRRRNVVRSSVAYAIVAWLLIQLVATIFPVLKLPEWTVPFVTVIILIGFPINVILAWAFEITPEGIKPTRDVPLDRSVAQQTGRKFDFAIIGLLVIAVVYLVLDNYVLRDEPAPVVADEVELAVPALERSIAVLPFANRSANEEDAYFVDGLHDDLLTQIAKIGSIKTISRTSVMPYRDTDKSLPEIAAELGVATILEGGVQRAGDTIRINMQLIDAANDEHLWAETYDRQLTASNVFAIQSEIASAIAEKLRARITIAEQARIDNVPTDNMAALEAYFKGRQRLMTRTSAGFDAAIEHFQQAIELDPDFALAYVGLATTYANQGAYTGLSPDIQATKAEAMLEQAMALDDGLGEAYALLGAIKNHMRQDYAGAEIALKRALELSPNYASAHQFYSLLLGALGRFDEAVIQAQQALELEPMAPTIGFSLGAWLLATGQFEEGLAQFERVVSLTPTNPAGYYALGVFYSSVLGELDKGVTWGSQAVERGPGDPNLRAYLGLLYLDLGDVIRAEYWLKQSIAIGVARTMPNAGMAMLHSYRDENDQALEYAYRAVQTVPAYAGDPIFWQWALRLMSRGELQADLPSEALSLYHAHYPALSNDDAIVDFSNYQQAIDLALVLTRAGERDRADKLLDRSLAFIQGRQRIYVTGYGIADVQIYALQGKTGEALAALRQAIDDGWRRYWWYHAEYDPNLDSIRDEPQFQAMMGEIRIDMATQLERVREMERNGELAATPELSVAD